MSYDIQSGTTLWVLLASLVILAGFSALLLRMDDERNAVGAESLTVFCAAGMREPMERIAERYREEFAVSVRLQYGGSNTLLGQMELAGSGDLYLAADESYINLAQEKGLVAEELAVAHMRPVIAVQSGNPAGISSLADLLCSDVRVALGNPDQAAIGKMTRKLLSASGHWDVLAAAVRANGVFKPTVNDIASDVQIGSVQAAIVWDPIVAQFARLEAVRVPELDAGAAAITIGVLTGSQQPTAALHFARYVTARDRGLSIFADLGYEVVESNHWAQQLERSYSFGDRATADAAIAYRTDCQAAGDRVQVIAIDQPEARAVQPFAVASRSDHPQTMRRLQEHIASQRQRFETLGFRWLADSLERVEQP